MIEAYYPQRFYYIVNWTILGYNLFMPRFYTAVGDDGYTGLLKEGRVPKNDPIIEAVGAIDEANAALGLARSSCQSPLSKSSILTAQGDLYHAMAEVSASPDNAARFRKVDAERVVWLEAQIETLSTQVQIPNEFIVPGDSFAGAALDLARTVVRRAERHIAGLAHSGVVDNFDLQRYLNRLSSLCFVLELYENQLSGMRAPTFARDITS
jgi:cob(I)alamin adenosyltransferase